MTAAFSATSATALLSRLEALRFTFGPDAAREKRRLLAALGRTQFRSAPELLRLHEALVYTRAYPDDEPTLALADRLLSGFARRADLIALRDKLEDSGVAGTDIHFRFFAPTALKLATHWPERLTYDWERMDDTARLDELLPLLAVHAETPGMDEYDLGLRGWLDRMRGPRTGDAAFVTLRLAARVRDTHLFEKLHDSADAAMRLAWGPHGPSRTLARWPVAEVAYQRGALRKGRPNLREELSRPPVSVTPLNRRDGERACELATEAMVTRGRDLDVFAFGDPDDVRVVDCGDGLQFLCIGALPSRRLLMESVYGMLTLKNGVPTGYVLTSALYGSAEIAYNVFETYRGGEAGAVYGRVLSMTKHLFGVDSFTIYPYQLGGAGNEEGLASGAWWFYRKLGFAPRDREARRVMKREEARMQRNAGHRSSRAALMQLGEANVYWHERATRDDVIGQLPLANVGLAVTDLLAKRFGGEGGRGAAECVREAAKVLGIGKTTGWSPGERLSFERWAPLVLLLPGLNRWSAAEKRALVAVARAKGGRRETDFVRMFDEHARLRAAIAKLALTARA